MPCCHVCLGEIHMPLENRAIGQVSGETAMMLCRTLKEGWASMCCACQISYMPRYNSDVFGKFLAPWLPIWEWISIAPKHSQLPWCSFGWKLAKTSFKLRLWHSESPSWSWWSFPEVSWELTPWPETEQQNRNSYHSYIPCSNACRNNDFIDEDIDIQNIINQSKPEMFEGAPVSSDRSLCWTPGPCRAAPRWCMQHQASLQCKEMWRCYS